MEIISVEGIVLSSVKYNENSKVLNVLTKEKGLIGIIAKGALKPKSPLKIVSENFTYAVFQIYFKENKLSTLIEADTINYFFNIKSDIIKFSYMSYLCELSKDVYRENGSNEIYDLLTNALLKIENGFDPKIITNIIEVKYLNFLGVGLFLEGCAECGKTSVVNISISRGGYVCAFHKTNEKQYSTSSIKMIKAYQCIDINKISELKIKEDVVNEIDEFLIIYYKEYTGLYLKSKNFLNQIKSN